MAVILMVAAVKPLRDQARLQSAMSPRPPAGWGAGNTEAVSERDPLIEWIRVYRQQCIAFVERRHPRDPDMLIAAAALSGPSDAGRSLLERALALNDRPLSWAAYTDALLQGVGWYYRVGASGVDPANSKAVAKVGRWIHKRKLPARLRDEEAAALLDGLAYWQEIDHQNALPIALEAWCLYGLGRDAEALGRWQAASCAPSVSGYFTERVGLVRVLLTRMGMPSPEVAIAVSTIFRVPSLERLSMLASASYYEGRRAQMAGNAPEALRWWQATTDLGRHAQESADIVALFTTGVTLERIGAAPAWVWYPDMVTGIRSPGMLGGRFFYGPQHAFYVSQVGESRDAELIERLVRARVRSKMLERFLALPFASEQYASATEMLVFGQVTAGYIIVALLAFVLFGSWSRGAADAATGIGPVPQFLLASLPLMLLAGAAGIVIAVAPPFPVASLLAPSFSQLIVAVGIPALVVVLLPAGAAFFSRCPSAALLSACRGNLRRVLPLTIALGALLYLGLGLAAMSLRAHWAGQWTQAETTEMGHISRWLGGRWLHPSISSDSWRAGYPPEPPQSGSR